MNAVKQFAVLLICSGLAACAAPQTWHKPGASNDAFYTESGQCQAMAYSAPATYYGQAQRVYDSCMQGKGWRLRKDGHQDQGVLNVQVPDGVMKPEYGISSKATSK